MLVPNKLRNTRCFCAALLTFSLCTFANAQSQPGSTDSSTKASSAGTASNTATSSDPSWHTNLNFYLWFPGAHGALGAKGYDVDYHASATDLLSNFKFGLMGAVGAQRGRVLIFTDLMWIRLAANKQAVLPLASLPELSAQTKAGQLIISPEVGYRFFDGEKIKIDALGGLRYWHLESSLQFTPSRTGVNFSGTQNWADPLLGARFQAPLSRKLLATIQGDAGGWGAGSQLDYQIFGALSFRVSEKWALDAGYRYLYVDYRPGYFVYETAMSGAFLGVTYSLK